MPQPMPVELPHPPTAARVVHRPGGAGDPTAMPADGSDATALRLEEAALQGERAELARARQALERAAAEVAGLRQQVLADAEEHLLDLAVEIARKVLMQEIRAGRHEIEPIVREALRRAPAKREVVVRLNPKDLARMETASGTDEMPANVRLVPDPSIGPAECVVETAEGTVEARVEHELDQVRAALKTPEEP